MATPTQLDILNAVQYLSNRDSLSYISKWRNRFPHILIDYSLRWATSEKDFYVPPSLRETSAVIVDVFFSRQGCESMSCFPYTETGVIDFLTSPIGGYSQTSNTPVQYNQPACFNMDPAKAARDGNIQSVELRYTRHEQCVMVDSFTKAWMNAPYIRTSKHVVRGVDDVPGFDVANDDDPAFPERVTGRFNEAYCRRFGRNEDRNGCSQPWYETIVSFVLGESIMTTFKLAATHVFDDLRDFDYKKPSALVPDAPPPEGIGLLEDWYRVTDGTIDVGAEANFLNNVFPIVGEQVLRYTANEGFSFINPSSSSSQRTATVRARGLVEELLERRVQTLARFAREKPVVENYHPTLGALKTPKGYDENQLENIIMDFLEDHAFIMGILADLGFNVLESTLTTMLKQINKVLIPSLRRMLLMQTRRMTVALLGETYKAAAIHALNRTLIATVTTLAKATVRTVKAAASLVNIALTFLTIADLVLMVWDPFGYNNMFPRGYLDDLSTAFLSAYYESLDAPSRDLIEFAPKHFSNLVVDDEEDYFTESMLHLVDYMAALDVNSNGQIVDLTVGDEVSDVDEEQLVGAGLAANDTWLYFKWFCARHNELVVKPSPLNNIFIGVGFLASISGFLYYLKHHRRLTFKSKIHLEILFALLVVLSCLLLFLPSLQYYTKLVKHQIK